MRIISQDRTIDIPYNLFSLSVASGKYKDVEYSCIYCHNIYSPHSTKMAEYSSKEKAVKAMEMLREQYEKLEVFKVLACGTMEYVDKTSDYEELVEYNSICRGMNVFQFPKDDEIEVM